MIRGEKVIVDADLAEFYGVQTKVLNQAVRRNMERFPADFMFQLNKNEKLEVVTNCDHLPIVLRILEPQQWFQAQKGFSVQCSDFRITMVSGIKRFQCSGFWVLGSKVRKIRIRSTLNQEP